MDRNHVELLEEELEEAITKVVRRLVTTKQIGAPPSRRTYHLMAKAAAAVLEAVAEENPSDR
jgi:hypothetical protein